MSLRLPAVFCRGHEVLGLTVIYYQIEVDGCHARRVRRVHADQLSHKSKHLMRSMSATAPHLPSWRGDNWRRGDAPKRLFGTCVGAT